MQPLARIAWFRPVEKLLFSIAGVSLCFQTALLLDWLFIPRWFYLFILCCSFWLQSISNLKAIRQPANTATNSSSGLLKTITLIANIVATIIFGYFSLRLHKLQFAWLFVWICLIAACNFPFHRYKNIAFLREHRLLKLFTIIIAWLVSTIIIPATFIPFGFDRRFWWLLAVRFFYLLSVFIAAALQYELREAKTAKLSLVLLFGEEGSYKLCYAALAISAFGIVPGLFIGINILWLIPILISLVISGQMINYSRRHLFSPASHLLPAASMILQTLLVCIPLLIP
jgi:hypothetical protein